jgi:hypothetical protein
MSRELKPTQGLREDPENKMGGPTNYLEAKLFLTAFNGGKERGQCVQVTPQSEYVQLDKDGVKDLINTLQEWVDEKEAT